MLFFYDPTFPLLIVAVILGLLAQHHVQSTFAKYSRIISRRGLTGADVAKLIVRERGLGNLPVELIPGNLTDHYDPRERVLRLSEPVYASKSLAALGVAAHEAGHAIQHAEGYTPMMIRHSLVPLANLGSQLLIPAIIGGVLFSFKPLLYIGIVAYFFAVVFSIVTLPVEFDASKRALRTLETSGYLIGEELDGARKVLRAAAMTYIAAMLVSIINLLRLLLLARSRD